MGPSSQLQINPYGISIAEMPSFYSLTNLTSEKSLPGYVGSSLAILLTDSEQNTSILIGTENYLDISDRFLKMFFCQNCSFPLL